MELNKSDNRGNWSSKLGFILAAAGSAIGLGNIWAYPSKVADNGGAAFILIYVLCCFLVGYPIMKLPDPIDVVGYVRWLEQVLMDSIAEFGLYTERVEGRSGVWAPVGNTHVKIAAIGIRVAERTTMHGFALNCNNSLQAYETIIACGIKDAETSTISELVQRNITPAMASEVIQKHLTSIGKVTK